MKPAESCVDQPIRSLQTMLRTIASIEPSQINVMPDGIYGSQTGAAVRSFQRRQGLNPTGIVDQQTHERIVREYERAYIEARKAQPVQINLDPGQVLRRGEKNNHIYLAQSMLTVLHLLDSRIPAPPHTGVLERTTPVFAGITLSTLFNTAHSPSIVTVYAVTPAGTSRATGAYKVA